MIKVFEELGFVKITDGMMTYVENPENHPLESSKIYQKRAEEIKTQSFFMLSDAQTLRTWFSK
jgi:single-stranded-DNA-specific exonuclease